MIAQNTQGRQLGILGEPRVNVLALNLALDAAQPDAAKPNIAASDKPSDNKPTP